MDESPSPDRRSTESPSAATPRSARPSPAESATGSPCRGDAPVAADGALRPALGALSDGSAPQRGEYREVVARARAAAADVERLAAFLSRGGRARLERAVRAAERRGDRASEARGRRVLDALDRFQHAAAAGEPANDGRGGRTVHGSGGR